MNAAGCIHIYQHAYSNTLIKEAVFGREASEKGWSEEGTKMKHLLIKMYRINFF